MLHICVLQCKTWKKKRGAKSFPHMPCPNFGGFSLGLDDIQELWANLTPIQMGPVAIFYQESPLVRCNTIILQREILEGKGSHNWYCKGGGLVAVERSHCCRKEWLLQLQPQSPTSNHRLWQWWNQKGWKISHTPSFCQSCLCLDLQVYLSSMGLLSQKMCLGSQYEALHSSDTTWPLLQNHKSKTSFLALRSVPSVSTAMRPLCWNWTQSSPLPIQPETLLVPHHLPWVLSFSCKPKKRFPPGAHWHLEAWTSLYKTTLACGQWCRIGSGSPGSCQTAMPGENICSRRWIINPSLSVSFPMQFLFCNKCVSWQKFWACVYHVAGHSR